MAGYVFAVSKEGWNGVCERELRLGFFTPMTPFINTDTCTARQLKNNKKTLSSIFGDLITMKNGDNIYFLSNRKIYGIGITYSIGTDCKYDNYLNASALLSNNQQNPIQYLTPVENTLARWVVFFKPSPYLFSKGVDMDDVLRFRPNSFKVLRAFQGVSFIKIDDDENRALREYIALSNENAYQSIEDNTFIFDDTLHNALSDIDLSPYTMDINKAYANPTERDIVFSEMFLEGFLLQQLSNNAIDFIGKWDYLSHQLIASPFKPLDYIDKIDIFGYRFSNHYHDEPQLITKYIIIELKKDKIDQAAIEQTMQYVDWVCHEYASGDYSKIEAYIVGKRTTPNIEAIIQDVCQRSFIRESHPAKPDKWNDLHMITYNKTDTITFEKVELNETP